MHGAIATSLTIAVAAIVVALAGFIHGSWTWGVSSNAIAVFGAYLSFATILAAPLLAIGLATRWLVYILRLPRPAIEMLGWGGGGVLLMWHFWNPMFDALADTEPSFVNADVLGIVGFACAGLGAIAWLIERGLGKLDSAPQR